MKRERKTVDGTPNKRLFWSIISDYNLNTSICELIDNALDIWLKNERKMSLTIKIDLDWNRQLIRIQDCAGGVAEEELQVLVSPGASNNNPEENIIGLFGVGSKRAVVALAEDIKIFTRHKSNKSFEIDIDEKWLADTTWDMPIYEVDEIPENTTIVDLSKLRIIVSEEEVEALRAHLSETYALFLKRPNFEIILNDIPIEPIEFDEWAYPPGFEPRCCLGEIITSDNKTVGIELHAGLIRKKEPGKDDYGVYFYCNDRLIIKEVKDREVGYVTKLAGIPHFDASLARVIVKLYGAANLMPWNSSKSAVNFGHHIFRALESFLIPVVSDYSSLSRRLKGHWEEEVFAYPKGDIEYVDAKDITKAKRSFLPPLPKIRKHRIDVLKATNKELLEDQPWLLGIVEAIGAIEIIDRQKLETKNRISLILLDSNFEIALKEYIVHNPDINLGSRTLKQIFKNRDDVIKVVNQKVILNPTLLTKIKHYYLLRNKLIHERATVDVTDTDVVNYLITVQRVLNLLFGLEF